MKYYINCIFYWVVFNGIYTVCDRIGDNEAKITMLAKELQSLHRRVDAKISLIKEQVEINRGAEEGHRYYQMRKLFRKFDDMKFQFLTLKMDIRQLFYRDMFIQRDMERYVRNKTDVLNNKMTKLQDAMKMVMKLNNESADLEFLKSIENEANGVGKETEKSNPGTSKEPLQDMEITMVVGERFAVPCEHEDGNTQGKLQWFRNGRRLDVFPTKRFSIRYSEKTKSSTFTISKLQQKDFGIIECKDENFRIVVRVHLYVKEPCKEYLCDGSCVSMSKICDKVVDCPRGQDEKSCDLVADILRGDVPGKGLVILLLNKMKGLVCDNGLDVKAAGVICRALGFSTGQKGQSEASSLEKGFVVSNVSCKGNENSLVQCNTSIANAASCESFGTVVCR